MSPGPSVVAIGGGHGLARTLRAVTRYASRVAAVASVADDGGSSGRLRRQLQIPAVGDLRKCLVALLPEGSAIGRALEHRFDGGGELEGHALGNLLIAALAASAGGFVEGVLEAGRLLGVAGEVLPATSGPVVLRAEAGGREVEGQVRIMATPGVTRVTLSPEDAEVPGQVLEAIAAADQVVIGPGSLYTSVLAALAPAPIRQALAGCKAQVVYVCNLREQVPETSGYDVAAHVEALGAHGLAPDWVLADSSALAVGELPDGPRLLQVELAPSGSPVHDPVRLADALAGLARRPAEGPYSPGAGLREVGGVGEIVGAERTSGGRRAPRRA